MSACFSLGLEAAEPIKAAAQAMGSEALYAGLPAILLITLGGFFTNAVYCLFQNFKNKTIKDYFGVSGTVFTNNVLFSALAGVLWYSQFFGLALGKSFLPEGSVMMAFSWSILMSLNITFSNVWGMILKEWKGVKNITIGVLVLGMAILIFSLILPNIL
jgi:L-rhamnose-H+ transport protein